MNRRKKLLINIILVILLFFIFLKATGRYLTPLRAHRASEKSIHYGPSEVVHVEDFPGGKYMLSKYDKWISANTVNRSMGFFWRFGDQVTGIENDLKKPVNYSAKMSDGNIVYYGIVNDDRVSKLEIELENEEVLVVEEFYDDMFIHFTRSENDDFHYVKVIRGYDLEGKEIFQEKDFF